MDNSKILDDFADSLKAALPAFTKAFQEVSDSVNRMNFPKHDEQQPMSPTKIRRAKLRKKKRKRGGPR